jgi:hypothetical protein
MNRACNRLAAMTGMAIVLGLLAAQPAAAYGGPTLGLSALGSFFALLGAILAGIFGFIWYPIKRLLRSLRRSKAERPDSDP